MDACVDTGGAAKIGKNPGRFTKSPGGDPSQEKKKKARVKQKPHDEGARQTVEREKHGGAGRLGRGKGKAG